MRRRINAEQHLRIARLFVLNGYPDWRRDGRLLSEHFQRGAHDEKSRQQRMSSRPAAPTAAQCRTAFHRQDPQKPAVFSPGRVIVMILVWVTPVLEWTRRVKRPVLRTRTFHSTM